MYFNMVSFKTSMPCIEIFLHIKLQLANLFEMHYL